MLNFEPLFHALLEMAVDLIAVVDKDGVVRYAGPSVQSILGFRDADVLARPFIDFVHPDDVTAARASLESIKRTPGSIIGKRPAATVLTAFMC